MNIADVINNDWIFVMRLLVAMLLGGFVGMERQNRGRAAGLRTNILVCLGSAAIIVAFQKLSLEVNVGAESVIRMDPARAAAGVITGIGFLGAGTIIKSKDFVRGLTTAASIWVVSAIGVIVGLGELVVAVALTMLVLVSLYALHRLSFIGDQYFSLHLKWHGKMELLDEVTDQLLRGHIEVRSRNVMRQPNTEKCQVVLGLCLRKQKILHDIVNKLQSDKRFDEVAWS
jgi:putative Mg2+ transporter-C (MgtC) family protein